MKLRIDDLKSKDLLNDKIGDLKSKDLLNDKIGKVKPEERMRNRVRSMNSHGINVFSLKKLKIHR